MISVLQGYRLGLASDGNSVVTCGDKLGGNVDWLNTGDVRIPAQSVLALYPVHYVVQRLNILILFNEAVEDTVVLQLRGTDPQHGVTVSRTDSLPFTLSCAAASSGSVPALRVGNGGNLEKDNS